MKRAFRAMTLPALALGTLLGSGCGPSSTNEDSVANTRAPGAENAPVFKTYGEKVQHDTDEFAKKRAAGKGAKGQPAPTPKAQPANASAPAETRK